MAKLDEEGIGKFAHAAGITKFEALRDAISIAMAESSGRTDARNNDANNAKWGPAVGLWQIRSLRAEEGKGTMRDASKLTDPAFNAASMFQISNGGKNWDPWDAYWNGKFLVARPFAAIAARKILGTNDAVDDIIGGAAKAPGAVGDAVDATAGGIADISAAVKGVAAWFGDRNNVMRVAKVVAGGALLVGGLFIFARPVAEQGASTVAKVVKGK